jgi:hypothetical protein
VPLLVRLRLLLVLLLLVLVVVVVVLLLVLVVVVVLVLLLVPVVVTVALLLVVVTVVVLAQLPKRAGPCRHEPGKSAAMTIHATQQCSMCIPLACSWCTGSAPTCCCWGVSVQGSGLSPGAGSGERTCVVGVARQCCSCLRHCLLGCWKVNAGLDRHTAGTRCGS